MTHQEAALCALLTKGTDASVLRDLTTKSSQGNDRLCCRAPDGAGSRGADRRRTWRAQPGPPGAARRLPGPGLGLGGAGGHGREGPHRRDRRGSACFRVGSLHPGRLDAQRGCSGAGHGEAIPRSDVSEADRGGTGVSKSQASRLCAEIDERVGAFLDRPIEGEWPYLWLDATYVKARRDHRIVSMAVIVAVAVNTGGRREVLGMTVGNSEAEHFWTEFLRSLARRGLRGAKLVISDAHEGPKAAANRVLGATAQRCKVHFQRNAMAHAGKTQRRIVAAWIGTAFAEADQAAAHRQWRAVADQLRPRVNKLAELMDGAEHDVLASMSFPAAHRAKISSNASTARSSAGPTWSGLRASRDAPQRSGGQAPRRRPPPRAA